MATLQGPPAYTTVPRVSLEAIRRQGEEQDQTPTSGINVGKAERWGSAIVGGLLVAGGIRRGSFSGLGLAVLGGALAYRGFSGHCQAYQALNIDTSGKHRADDAAIHKGRLVKHTATINRPAEEIHAFLQEPANYMKFADGLDSVTKTGETWHWAIPGPLGKTFKFDSQVISNEPGRLLAWKSVPGGDVDNAGTYRLVPSWDGRGTVVTLEVNYEAPGGAVGASVAKLLGFDADARAREDLRRLKAFLETGEIPTVEGQTSGRLASKS